jgi:membrane protease YdiL (CAAX protease family)
MCQEAVTSLSNVPDVGAGGRRVRRVAVFYCSTFLVTRALVAAYLLSGGSFRRLDSFVFANLTMCVPGLVAACTARFYFRQSVTRVLGLSLRLNRWFVLSPIYSLLAQALILGPTLSAIAGLGEEAGWRGLLHHELRGLGFWRESWIVGLLWGLWHLPLVFEGYGFPNQPLAGACLLLAFTLLAAPLYTFIRIRAESTLACAIFHGSFSASMLLTFAPVAGGSELTVGLLALPGVLMLSLANAGLAGLPARHRA